MGWKRCRTWLAAAAVGTSTTLAGPLRAADPASLPERDAVDMIYKGSQLGNSGRYDECIDLERRALDLLEKQLGPSSVGLVRPLDELAACVQAKGDDQEVERLHLRAIAILEKERPNDPDLVLELWILGLLYHRHGDDTHAEPLLLRAAAIGDAAVAGADKPRKDPRHLYALAELYQDQGDYARAEPLLVKALAITEDKVACSPDTIGPDRGATCRQAYPVGHPMTVAPLVHLGALYRKSGDLDRARPLLEKAHAIIVANPLWKADRHYNDFVIVALELGALYADLGEVERAAPLLDEGYRLSERSAGPGSLTVARCQNEIGALHLQQSDDRRAEPLLAKALSIRDKTLGPMSLDVAETLDHLGDMALGREDARAALEVRRRGAAIRDYQAALMLAGGSELRKRLYMATLRADTDAVVSLHTRGAPSSGEAAELALATILRRKGWVLDAMADSFAGLRKHLTPDAQLLLDQLGEVDRELSAHLSRGPGDVPPDRHRAHVEELDRKREEIEARVSEKSAAFRAARSPPTLEQVRRAIPEDAALVEITRYRPRRPRGRAPDRWEEPSYVAYLLRRSGPVRFANLGPAGPIDAAARTFRRVLADRDSNPKPAARALDAAVMQPVRAILGDTRRVFVSPDGPLNLVPFNALVDETGHYLIERLSLTYLTGGRDLVRLATRSKPQQGPLVIASPAFGPLDAPVNAEGGTRGTRSVDMAGERFRALPGTEKEGRAIGSAIAGSDLRMGERATEAAVKAARAPRILHIATHGFFLPDDSDAHENPLLRAGLALQGANPRIGEDGEDGVLTALEASALDLEGTKLIVLSACDTGVGEASVGEGVFGLRRALVMAGAETQVMSLWRVDDDATYALMVAYYQDLLAGVGRSEALRRAELGVLREKRTAHPFYWASFIASGADGPLVGGGSLGTVAPPLRGCACRLGPGDPGGGAAAIGLLGIGIARRIARRRADGRAPSLAGGSVSERHSLRRAPAVPRATFAGRQILRTQKLLSRSGATSTY